MKQTPGGGTIPPPGRFTFTAGWPRSRTFGLLAGIYLCKPTRESIEGWRSLFVGSVPNSFSGLHASLLALDPSENSALDDLLWEYTRLFIGPYRLPAPPWESVYTSPKRLLMQEAYDAVQDLYREAGLTIPDIHVLADHIGSELNFLAVLYERTETESGPGKNAAETAERFLSEHLRKWIPAFSRDLEEAAEMDLYRELARATRAAVDLD
jgi:TorA maturation chaperone TorD